MIDTAQAYIADEAETGRRSFAADTAFLLFFLGIDCGQRLILGVEGLLTAVTVAMFVVFPYFLPHEGERPRFGPFVLGRSALAILAVLLGLFLSQMNGPFLPENLRFVSLTLVMLSGFVCCVVQFSNILRFRLVK